MERSLYFLYLFTMMVCISISIAQQAIFDRKICTTFMTYIKSWKAIWGKLQSYHTKHCTQGITSKTFLWIYPLYTKQLLLLPKATCQAELMLPIFWQSSTLGGPFRTQSTDLRQMFLGMLLSLKTKKQNFTEF